MLTVKAPIELHCTTLLIPSEEAFYKRITGNYEMMTAGITEEELLHVVTTPPEIYFAGDGMTNIMNNTNISSKQETKIDVINNLMNRILISEEANLTYQDRVYITNILHKLGIRDEKLFMQQVKNIKEEANNTSRLVNLYWEYVTDLQEMLSEYQSSEYVENAGDTSVNRDESIHLHEDIMNRLQTAAIYQVLNNFHKNNLNMTEITENELLLSEQSRISQNILLQELKNTARSEEMPLLYRHENYYEEQELSEENITEENVTRQMTSAVLLNLIDNVLQSRLEHTAIYGDQYFHMENALFSTAENTLNRLKYNLSREYRTENKAGDYITNLNRANRTEINVLNQLFEGGKTMTIAKTNRILTESPEEEPISEEDVIEISKQVTNLLDNRHNVTELSMENVETHTEENYLAEQNYDVLEQQLQIINQRNIENHQKYVERVREIQKRMEITGERMTPEEMKRSALLALTHPDVFLQNQKDAAIKSEERENAMKEAMKEALPEETKQVFTLLQQYIDAPEQLKALSGVSEGNLGMLMHDITEIEKTNLVHDSKVDEVSEEVREITEKVTEHWNEPTLSPKAKNVVKREVEEHVEMIHKTQNEISQEELLESMMEQSKILQQRNEVKEQVVETKTVENTTLYNEVDNQVLQRTEDITEMIQQGVRSQIGTISNQVFQKLEKKLESEKRRRGL